ncbi:MAG: thioredoxin family protein [Pirellulaceae bacterium]|nr:thioredoxin family protein [Pirellulaceae bacterium]
MRTLMLMTLLIGMVGCNSSTLSTCAECGTTVDQSNGENGAYCETCAVAQKESSTNSSGQAKANPTGGQNQPHYQGFLRDLAAAKSQAAKEGKSIMMLFTGSDWCPPCMALHEAVFTSEEFNSKIPEECVLLVLDSPRDQSSTTSEEKQQYKSMSAEFGVEGVPSIFLTDADGKPYHSQSGYGGNAANAWVSDLLAQVKPQKK